MERKESFDEVDCWIRYEVWDGCTRGIEGEVDRSRDGGV